MIDRMKDHPGSIRQIFRDDGTVVTVVSTEDYYPFGATLKSTTTQLPVQDKFKFLGKVEVSRNPATDGTGIRKPVVTTSKPGCATPSWDGLCRWILIRTDTSQVILLWEWEIIQSGCLIQLDWIGMNIQMKMEKNLSFGKTEQLKDGRVVSTTFQYFDPGTNFVKKGTSVENSFTISNSRLVGKHMNNGVPIVVSSIRPTKQ